MEFTITPLSAHTGAEVHGIDLTQPVKDVVQAQLNRAFVDHSVLVFRDQHLTPDQLFKAVGLFGEVFPQHNSRFALRDCPLVHYISNQDFYADGRRYIPGEGYHTDHSNAACPPKATVLHAVSLPDRGGDTQYVNMHLAYDDLPRATKRRLDGLKAIHVYQSRHSARKLMELSSESRSKVPDAVAHPIVRTHPESGRKAIYINPIRTEGIVGMPETEALTLLADLLEHATQPQYQYRHQWRLGDLVMWDNRSLLHKANGDYDMSQRRYLYRIMLQGDLPV
ncbi:MAG TPA: TauD/TfdA family dioxygenase [Stellaceae bacterium]|nr:TauD/TfdA family dioxygenase [Stellaceae bacterium]